MTATSRQKVLRRSYSIRCKICAGFGATDPYPDWPGYCRRCADEQKSKLSQSQPITKLLFASASCIPTVDFLTFKQFMFHKQNDKIVVWNLLTGDCTHLFCGHTSEVTSLVILKHENHPRVLSASSRETLLWDVNTGQVVKSFRAVPNQIVSDPHHPERVALSFLKSPVIEIWDFDKLKINPNVCTLRHGSDPVTCLSYIPKNQKLVASYTDKTVRLWHLNSQEQEIMIKEDSDIVSIHATQDHLIIITPKTCHFWSLPFSGKSLKIHSHRLSSVSKPVPFVKMNLLSLKEGFTIDKNSLKLFKIADPHYPDTYALHSIDMSYRLADGEQVVIGQFNNFHVCFILHVNK